MWPLDSAQLVCFAVILLKSEGSIGVFFGNFIEGRKVNRLYRAQVVQVAVRPFRRERCVYDEASIRYDLAVGSSTTTLQKKSEEEDAGERLRVAQKGRDMTRD